MMTAEHLASDAAPRCGGVPGTEAGGRRQGRRQAVVDAARREPHRLVDRAAELLGGHVVTHQVATTVKAHSFGSGELMHVSRAGRTFAHLWRPGRPFRRCDARELNALVRLAVEARAGDLPTHCLTLDDGHQVRVREPQDADRGFVEALQSSTSIPTLALVDAETGGRPPMGGTRGARLRTPITLIVVGDSEERVAAARLMPSRSTHLAEIRLVVQERWQQRGLGAALLLQGLAVAQRLGVPELRTALHHSDRSMQNCFREVGATFDQPGASGVIEARLPTAPPWFRVSGQRGHGHLGLDLLRHSC